jgi:hypothetical protein
MQADVIPQTEEKQLPETKTEVLLTSRRIPN